MTKIRLVQIIGSLLFLIYVILIIAERYMKVLGDSSNLIFSVILSLVSLGLIWKGKILYSSSTLWFGLSLILYAITIVVLEIIKYDIINYYLFVFVPIIASLIIFVIFKKLLYIKVIIFNIFLAIPIVLYNVLWLTWWWALIIGVVCIACAIVVNRRLNF